MTRRTVAVQRDDVSAGHEGDDAGPGGGLVSFGYRGEHFEVELDEAQQRELGAVLGRYIAAGRVTG